MNNSFATCSECQVIRNELFTFKQMVASYFDKLFGRFDRHDFEIAGLNQKMETCLSLQVEHQNTIQFLCQDGERADVSVSAASALDRTSLHNGHFNENRTYTAPEQKDVKPENYDAADEVADDLIPMNLDVNVACSTAAATERSLDKEFNYGLDDNDVRRINYVDDPSDVDIVYFETPAAVDDDEPSSSSNNHQLSGGKKSAVCIKRPRLARDDSFQGDGHEIKSETTSDLAGTTSSPVSPESIRTMSSQSLLEHFSIEITKEIVKLNGEIVTEVMDQCKICKVGFKRDQKHKRPWNFAEHIRKVHFGRVYQCALCPFEMKKKSDVTQHIVVEHGFSQYNARDSFNEMYAAQMS